MKKWDTGVNKADLALYYSNRALANNRLFEDEQKQGKEHRQILHFLEKAVDDLKQAISLTNEKNP